MKRLICSLLILALTLSCTFTALAAGRPVLSAQPETTTVDEGESATFKVKARNVEGLTWYFVNPETQEKTTARNIGKVFQGLKVEGANKQTLTLKKVPAEMNGWSLYCQVSGNGYKVVSDTVQLFVRAKGAPADTSAETPAAQTPAEPAAPAAEPAVQEAQQEPAAAAPSEESEYPLDEMGNPIVPDREITITAQNAKLFLLDGAGNITGDGASSLSFVNYANFAIRADSPVQYWTINGVRYESFENVTGFKITNVTDNMDLSAHLAPMAAPQVDSSVTVSVTCEGCSFTYADAGFFAVKSGNVPAGAVITVKADDVDAAENGYSINGGAPEREGSFAFRLTVQEDTTIVLK